MKLDKFPPTIYVFVDRSETGDPMMISGDAIPNVDHGTPVATYRLESVADMNIDRKLVYRRTKRAKKRARR